MDLATERAGMVTLHLRVHAPRFYPDIRTLRARRRELETEPRRVLFEHEGGNPGHSQDI